MTPMGIQIKSEWMIPQVETLRVLKNLSEEKYNTELECIQYTAKKKTKTLLVVANEKGTPGSIDIKLARILKTMLDETDFEHVYVFGETQTASAHNILSYHEKVTVATLKMRIRLLSEDILEAFKIVADSMCDGKCNPEDKDKCSTSQKNRKDCEIKTMLINAKFHARMGWKDQLLLEFTHLMELKHKMSEDEARYLPNK